MRYAGLCTFLAFLALSLIPILREAPLPYPHTLFRRADMGGALRTGT
jgi:hypothetical protein